MSALALIALYGSGSVNAGETYTPKLPKVEAEPLPLPPPPPVPYEPYEPYDPYPNDPGSGAGNDGGGTPEPAPEPTPPPACLELTSKGLPDGCSRALATAGTPTPHFQQPAEIDLLMHDHDYSYYISIIFAEAERTLAQCYADVSIPASACETSYVNNLSGVAYFYTGTADANLFSQGYQNLKNRMAVAESNRILAGNLSSDSVSFSFYNISLGSGMFANLALQDQYNKALIASREQKLCKLWYQVWDGNNCSN